ncbi:uncharacterized protein LOC115579544 [Sparus aurata]|uniref:uncharacterized protein LOC115579544 n=1 Tax=Sparus aurata TaxID=8175 RepID=UPI0011C0F21C|nr:uncharacterized protein LOC115579544 [Sparus aurata]
MASAPTRRGSKSLPPNLSELMKDLNGHTASFIVGFDHRESTMRKIIEEFAEISKEVRDMQWQTDTVRTGVVATGLLGAVGAAVVALGFIAAPLTGGSSLAAAAVGTVALVGANVRKTTKESESVKKVEELGKQFMETVEPLKKILEGIQTTCEKLEQKKTEAQAEDTLLKVEEFKITLTRVSELGKRTGEVLDVAVTVMERINNLLKLFLVFFSVSATPEQDRKLRESIIQSADQCQNVTDNFDKMKEELKDFRKLQTVRRATV